MLIIEHTVAVSLEVGVGDLRLELLAHALVFLFYLASAGAVASRALKSFFNDLDDLLVGVKSYLHRRSPFVSRFFIIVARKGGFVKKKPSGKM